LPEIRRSGKVVSRLKENPLTETEPIRTMTATLTFRIPQTLLNVWEAHTLAEILNEKPLTRRGNWVFQVELCEELEWTEDAVGADSAAWKHWTENMRPDVYREFGHLKGEQIEEALEITTDGGEREVRTPIYLGVAR
jgi:hypothetical protein